ncbi:hypothetical protein ACX0GZ_06655 [Sphingomonas aestuarii]|jgi:hypothetical protein
MTSLPPGSSHARRPYIWQQGSAAQRSAMRCIRSSAHRTPANLPFEPMRRPGGGQANRRGLGIAIAVGAVAIAGIALFPDREPSDTAPGVQIAHAQPPR